MNKLFASALVSVFLLTGCSTGSTSTTPTQPVYDQLQLVRYEKCLESARNAGQIFINALEFCEPYAPKPIEK